MSFNSISMERFKVCVAVHLLIIENGKILLQRRNNPNKHGYGMLGMPAGHLQMYENVYDAMQREAKEELDIELIDFDLIQVMNLNGDTDVYDAYFFIAKKYNGIIKNNEHDECKKIEWHDISQNINKLIPYEQYALNKYFEDKNNVFTLYGWDN